MSHQGQLFTVSTDLTRREKECLILLSKGFMAKNIGEQLGISNPTVELHIRNAKKRLEAKTTIEAVVKAISLKAIDCEGHVTKQAVRK